MNFDQIKKLWTLKLVIQHKSLKRASIHAKVSASAVSQTITSLERTFGKPLLIRQKGWATPTQEAILLLETVKPAFDAFEQLGKHKLQKTQKVRWLSFGTYESLAIDLVPGLICSLRSKLPHLKLELRISRTGNLLTMVRKGELSAALVTEVDDLDRFYVKEVMQDRLGLYVSKTLHPTIDPRDALKEIGYGSLAPGKGGLPRYFSNFLKHRALGRPMVLSDSFETLRAAAVSGSIVAVLPSRVAARQDDLTELILNKDSESTFSERGGHRILVVSKLNCDPIEADFLAKEAKILLRQQIDTCARR